MDGVCLNCRKQDSGEEVHLFSAANNTLPDEMPTGLPELTQVEEILISRVHVFLEVRLGRGQQYRYQGHVVHFLRDIGRVYDQLPLLPAELDIILLRPTDADENPRMRRQCTQYFRVRRRAIIQWLDFLRQNHSGYRDIQDQIMGCLGPDIFNLTEVWSMAGQPPDVELPEILQEPNIPQDQQKVGFLMKSMNGLKQAPGEWYSLLHDVLISMGFIRAEGDHLRFVKKGGPPIYGLIYVDDLLILSPSEDLIGSFKKEFSKHFDITDKMEVKRFLG